MKINKYIVWLFFILPFSLVSQNLVINPGFENLKAPMLKEWAYTNKFNLYVSDWQSLGNMPAQIYKYDSTIYKGIYSSTFKSLPPSNYGRNMAGIYTYGTGNEPLRSYIQGQLTKPLIKGNKYNISFLIAPYDFTGELSVSNNIGIYFSKKKLPVSKESILHYKPQFNYKEIPPIKNPKEWFTISWTYIAQDTFKYFTIGNFFNNDDTKFRNTNKKSHAVEFIIDNVKIEEVIERDTIKEKNLLNKMELNKPLTLNNIYFETGKSNLLDSSFAELNTLFNILKSKPKMVIQISGYTDNIGKTQDNIVLSEARANAVKKYLTDKGIDNNRIIAKGYGSSNPKASNDTAEGRAKNRRVEIMVLKNE